MNNKATPELSSSLYTPIERYLLESVQKLNSRIEYLEQEIKRLQTHIHQPTYTECVDPYCNYMPPHRQHIEEIY